MTSIKITYPQELPVSREINSIRQALLAHQIVIVCGETGSGKTTQLPKLLYEMGLAQNGIIGHTQPRKVAARSISHRINYEILQANSPDGSDIGDQFKIVGYKVRFNDKTSTNTKIKLMTDGILLQEIASDKLLRHYSALIIDEAHERSLNIDFILGYLKNILLNRPDLKIIITSATIDNQKLSTFFNNAPVIDVAGKTYPVDIIYQPPEENNLNLAIYQAIESALAVEQGNILIFLPGEREIKDCLAYLRKTPLRIHELLPLFARQSEAEQNLVFNPSGRLKIIAATNVAETSLTIPGIKFVIDSGIARVKRYNIRNRVEQLLIEPVAQSSSKQRAGRAGRTSAGMCIRLFSEEEFNLRSQFNDPEIIRSNLANVILRLIGLRLGDPRNFPFLDIPLATAYNDGFKTLFQLGAIAEDNNITQLGRQLVKIPLDVNLARILIAAGEFNYLADLLIIVSFLAIIDPRESPLEYQQQSREKHQLWANKKSDFVSILNLWNWYNQEVMHKKSNKKLQEKCRSHFLSFLRMREWHELHGQLKEIMHNLGYEEARASHTNGTDNPELSPDNYQAIHQALLSGLLNNIGQKDLVEDFYLGTNSKKFILHPVSTVNKSKWIMAASLNQTTRLYARNNAYIEPHWLIPLTKHLVKYTYSHHTWDKKRGEVTTSQHIIFAGLEIGRIKTGFAKIDPELAREIFIKQGVIPNELGRDYPFQQHNQKVLDHLEQLEDKFRVSLVFIEDELFEFYDKVLPDGIYDIRTFEVWCKENEKQLCLDVDVLLNKLLAESNHIQLYPDHLITQDIKLKLSYVFSPDSKVDGVTATIFLGKLSLIREEVFSWLVPGLIRDKISYLVKTLPKSIRIALNPVNEFITQFLAHANLENSLTTELVNYLKLQHSITLRESEINAVELPAYLRCHFQIMDKHKVIASGDNLAELKRQLLKPLNPRKEMLNEIKAKLSTQLKYLENKRFKNFDKISMYLKDIYQSSQLLEESINFVLRMSVDLTILPRDEEELRNLVDKAQSSILENAVQFADTMFDMSTTYHQVKLKIHNHQLRDEIIIQLDDLIFSGFLRYVRYSHLIHFPRYLKAILRRLEKYDDNPQRDVGLSDEIETLYDAWYNYVDKLEETAATVPQQLYDFKYKIEELRVSLFAQELKTLYPVSLKRLWRELDEFNK